MLDHYCFEDPKKGTNVQNITLIPLKKKNTQIYNKAMMNMTLIINFFPLKKLQIYFLPILKKESNLIVKRLIMGLHTVLSFMKA